MYFFFSILNILLMIINLTFTDSLTRDHSHDVPNRSAILIASKSPLQIIREFNLPNIITLKCDNKRHTLYTL